MQQEQLHEDQFLRILWDEQTRIIGIDWKEATSAMTSEDFKAELAIFATHVEQKRAPAILVDVSKFRHKPAPEVQEWRVKNISNRYNVAGVKRFAFLLSKDSPIPPMLNQASPGESFLTRAFNDFKEASDWLTAQARETRA